MPYTGIVLAFVGYAAAAFLVLLGHWVTSVGMFPKATRAFADVYDRRPIRAALVGILVFGPLILLLLNNAKIPNVGLRVIIVVAGFSALLIAFVGSAGLALRIGRNLCSGPDAWPQVLRGGTMLALVFITPFLGWFFILPVGLASGLGAFLLARPWRSPVAPAVPAKVPPPPPGAEPSLA